MENIITQYDALASAGEWEERREILAQLAAENECPRTECGKYDWQKIEPHHWMTIG